MLQNWIIQNHNHQSTKNVSLGESQIKDVNVKDKQSLPQDLLDLPLNLVDTKKTTTLKEIVILKKLIILIKNICYFILNYLNTT